MIVERVRYGSRGQGTLIRYDDSPNWFSCYYANGKEHRESTGHPDLKKARAWHRKKLYEIASERQGYAPVVTPSMKSVTIDELLDNLFASPEFRALKGADTAKYHAVAVRTHFGSWRALNLTGEAWDSYIQKRRNARREDSTINRERAILLSAYKLAVKRKRLSKMQVPTLSRLPENNVRRGYFEKHEFEAVVTHLPEYLQDAAWFAFYTAWRKSDVRNLKWADIDTQAMTVVLPTTKNGDGRSLALPDELVEIVKRREAARLITTPSGDVRVVDHVFHRNGEPIGDFRKAWRKACIEAGLYHVVKDANGRAIKKPSRIFHDLRRTGVRNLRRAGVDETVAMRISGHKTVSVFRRYNIVDETDLRQAMKAVVEHVATLPTSREER
jgi:integrase